MSAESIIRKREAEIRREMVGLPPQPQPPPKQTERVSIPHGSKDQEIENLKRLLANVSQRLDALKTR